MDTDVEAAEENVELETTDDDNAGVVNVTIEVTSVVLV